MTVVFVVYNVHEPYFIIFLVCCCLGVNLIYYYISFVSFYNKWSIFLSEMFINQMMP